MDSHYEEEYTPKQSSKHSNVLPLWGNERTMNLNPLILTNIQSSHYFKVNLYELKTYHEVVDEIYYKVTHLEPWEKGSRRTSGQTGMCGGVRGVGAGGIVSTAYCLLFKLFTLRLTRKQLNGLITHCDSPYIRALGFMYVRYTQPPPSLWDWFEPYLNDTDELDVKAGGGQIMTMGQILRQWLVKLEWFSTLFPRIPVPIQQKLNMHLSRLSNVPLPQTAVCTQQSLPINNIPITSTMQAIQQATTITVTNSNNSHSHSHNHNQMYSHSHSHSNNNPSSALKFKSHSKSRSHSRSRTRTRSRSRLRSLSRSKSPYHNRNYHSRDRADRVDRDRERDRSRDLYRNRDRDRDRDRLRRDFERDRIRNKVHHHHRYYKDHKHRKYKN